MVDNAAPGPASLPGSSTVSLGEPVDFDVRGLGRRLPRTEAPDGWVKKVDRQREGKVWVGFFHIWTPEANGGRVRRKKKKTLGPASMPKHEAQYRRALGHALHPRKQSGRWDWSSLPEDRYNVEWYEQGARKREPVGTTVAQPLESNVGEYRDEIHSLRIRRIIKQHGEGNTAVATLREIRRATVSRV